MRRLLAAAVAAVALALAGSAAAAGPNYVVVSGRGLAHPVVLANWSQNERLLLAVANARRAHASVRGRPRVRLSEFWGWGGKPAPASPRGANQTGWFYPARGGRPALIRLVADGRDWLRIAPQRVIWILASHGVPISL